MRTRIQRTPSFGGVDSDAPRVIPHFAMLNAENCQRLHQASCRILEKTGVKVYYPQALQLLKQAGAQVDEDLTRIPAQLVDWAIASAPRSFALYNRSQAQPVQRQ
jgi:trimethylamine--corrinoid protein Co-methyltransferase